MYSVLAMAFSKLVPRRMRFVRSVAGGMLVVLLNVSTARDTIKDDGIANHDMM